MRSLLMMAIIAGASISGTWNAAAQQQQPCTVKENIFGAMARGAGGPAAAAQYDFERAVCDYRNCLAANSSNINACEGFSELSRPGNLLIRDTAQGIVRHLDTETR